MDHQKDFERRLSIIMEKYKSTIEGRDTNFLKDYISHCLDRDVIVSPRNFNQRKTSLIQKISKTILKVLLVVLLIIGAFLVFNYRMENSKADLYAKDANYWLYFFRRWSVRLGLNKIIYFQRLHEKDCLIQNPYFEEPPRQCFCGFHLKRYQLNDTERAKQAFLRKLQSGNNNPFIMRNAQEFPVSYTDLRSVVLDASEDFNSGNSFTTTLSGSRVSSDYRVLFSDEEEPPRSSVVSWAMNFAGAAHHMRTLFPRPFFIPVSQEINLSRTIFMFGSQAPKDMVKLSTDTFPGALYVQAWGRQVYALSSDRSCNCARNSIPFVLEQGDVLFYIPDIHDLYTKIGKNSTTYSLGYFGSVQTEVSKKIH